MKYKLIEDTDVEAIQFFKNKKKTHKNVDKVWNAINVCIEDVHFVRNEKHKRKNTQYEIRYILKNSYNCNTFLQDGYWIVTKSNGSNDLMTNDEFQRTYSKK